MAGEGMKMLVEHLKEFKDSTAKEIDDLRSKIRALWAQHDAMAEEVEERELQIAEHDRVVSNLQSVNSRKYRAEERGDWQTLVESLNEDREYLSKDLADINAATEALKAETEELAERARVAEAEAEKLRARLRDLEPEAEEPSSESGDDGSGGAGAGAARDPKSPARTPRAGDRSPGSPPPSSSILPTPSQARFRSLIQQHKDNHELHTRLLQERQDAQDEDAEIQLQVQKQREELHALRAEHQQLLLAHERLGGGDNGRRPGSAGGGSGGSASTGGGVGSQLRKLLRLCGRPDNHPRSVAGRASPRVSSGRGELSEQQPVAALLPPGPAAATGAALAAASGGGDSAAHGSEVAGTASPPL